MRSQIELEYDGTQLRQHTMSAEHVGHALVGLSDVVSGYLRANGQPHKDVEVRLSETRDGSVIFDVIILGQAIAQTAIDNWDNYVDVMSTDTATAIANTLAIGGSTGLGGAVIWLLRMANKLEGRYVAKEHISLLSNGVVRVEMDHLVEPIAVPLHLLEGYRTPKVRKGLARMIEPASDVGYDYFEMRQDGDRERIEHETAARIVDNLDDDVVGDETLNRYGVKLRVIQLAFDPKYAWRFEDEGAPIRAHVEDDAFIQRVVTEQESFRAGDVIVGDLRTTVKHKKGGRSSERSVVTNVSRPPDDDNDSASATFR